MKYTTIIFLAAIFIVSCEKQSLSDKIVAGDVNEMYVMLKMC
jgi:hypothetical protein